MELITFGIAHLPRAEYELAQNHQQARALKRFCHK